jgi:hypothetical protein
MSNNIGKIVESQKSEGNIFKYTKRDSVKKESKCCLYHLHPLKTNSKGLYNTINDITRYKRCDRK